MEKLKIDVDNRSPFLKRIYLRQGDSGIQTVLINVVSGDSPVDCTGYTVKFKANLSDGKLVTGEAEPKDLANGDYTYTFKSAESSVYGDVRNAYFQLYDEAGNSISGSNVLITVEKGVDITQDQAEGYVSELDKIIETVQGKADELAEFAEEEKDKITDETKAVIDFADSQKILMTEAVTDVQTFAESKKNDITSIKNDVSGFADEQKESMSDKMDEVGDYGNMQKVAMLNKRLEIEQVGNQEKAKILAVLPDVESSIAEQAEQIADLQEKLVDVDLHQAWANSPDGTVDFTTVYPGENLLNVNIPIIRSNNSALFPITSEILTDDSGTFTRFKRNKIELNPNKLSLYSYMPRESFYDASKLDGKTVVVSYDVRASIEMTATMRATCVGSDGSENKFAASGKKINITKDWQRQFVVGLVHPSFARILVNPQDFLNMTTFDGVYVDFKNYKVEIIGKTEPTVAPPYTPFPQDDPINCHPKYVGFGIMQSDDYQDYRWILNPEWTMANAIYGTEITTLKDQLADIQDWIQAHS